MDQDLESLKFPVGRFQMPATHTAADLAAWIDTIAAFPEQLRAALRPFDNAALDSSYRPGGWSIRQVVHHCADSHVHAFIRIKLALTEDWPTISPYQQDAWAKLPDSALPVAASLDLLDAVHTRWAHVMRSLDADQWLMGYFHPEKGRRVPLTEMAANYAWHCQTHLGHVKIVASRI